VDRPEGDSGEDRPGGERDERTTIHLQSHRRPDGDAHDGGGLAPLSKAASGLSALGRAQARAHALSEQAAGRVPLQPTPSGRAGPGSQAPRSAEVPAGSGGEAGVSGIVGSSRLRRGTRRPQGPRRRRRGRVQVGRGFPRPRGRRRLASRPRRVQTRRRRGLHRSRQRRLLRRVAFRLALAIAGLVVVAAVLVGVQARRAVPKPVLHQALPAATTVVAPVPVLPWPHSGEAAVAVAGIGTVGSAGPSTPVPIASLAKVMAAVVVLRDHPLAAGESGPEITITAADQAIYQADQAAGDSVAPVVAGESLSELQLLEALLVPSADNLAPVLATWDAGSQAAFVAKMNDEASTLGLHATHYADVDGVSPSTVSTATDQLRLAEAATAIPVLMSIVRQPQVSLPNSPLLSNYDTVLGDDGIVGIKTGSTTEAGGCFMFAADGTAAGRHVQVLGVVLGQTGTPLITAALDASRALIGPVLAALHPVTALPAGTIVGQISTPWSPPIPVTTARAVTVLHFGPLPVRTVVNPDLNPIPVRLPSGTQVATVTVTAGGQSQTVAARISQPTVAPSWRWRLERR
jgi:serine-type D-Ala-D-Ala carboxypeptidase (penicillin-binding protein 5/6)